MSARLAGVVLGHVLMAMATTAYAQAPDPHAGHAAASQLPPPAPTSSAPGPGPSPASGASDAHASHRMPAAALPAFVPPVTDEMRAAAFPDVHGHASHDRRVNGFVLFDQLEWRSGHGPGSLTWSNTGWVGGDINRVWFRTDVDGGGDGLDEAQAHVLYGRAIARWWDVVAGVRQDFQPGAQTWLAVGVQGLAPGFFEVEATAYLSDEGQIAAHVELEYDLLLTNRLVLQPTAEMSLYGKPNASLGVGSGLSTAEAGVRLRYHVTREFAPYVGVSWARAFGYSAATHDNDVPNGAPRLVTGVRIWF